MDGWMVGWMDGWHVCKVCNVMSLSVIQRNVM